MDPLGTVRVRTNTYGMEGVTTFFTKIGEDDWSAVYVDYATKESLTTSGRFDDAYVTKYPLLEVYL